MADDLPAYGFTYLMCNDVEAMRRFYIDGLVTDIGYQEDAYLAFGPKAPKETILAGKHHQTIAFKAYEPVPELDDFAMQPGWKGGKLEATSWSVKVAEEEFSDVVKRLQDLGAPAAFDKPQWQQESYWSFPVRDPMGNTVEVYTMPKDRKPASTDWPG